MSEAFDLHRQRGFEFVQSGRLEEAIAEWRQAAAINSNDAWTRRSLGSALFKLGETEEAIMEHQKAVRLQPDYKDAHQSLVFSLMKAGRPNEALAAVRQAMLACPNSPVLYSYLGYLLGLKADESKDKVGWEAAVAAFQQCTDLDPTNATAWHSLGVLHWRLGRKRKAIETLKAAVANNPNSLKALEQLGTYQTRTGDLRGAVQTIRAINVLPDSEEVKEYFADKEQCQRRCIFLLSLGAGLAAVVAGVWIWRRRR